MEENDGQLDKHHVEMMLAEYERAQEVAHHDDAVIYEVAAIVWSADTLLLGFILEVKCDSNQWLVILSSVVAILLTASVPFIHTLVKRGQMIAFQVCREIESSLPLPHRLHTRIHDAYPKKRWTYAMWFLSGVFACTWICIIYHAHVCLTCCRK